MVDEDNFLLYAVTTFQEINELSKGLGEFNDFRERYYELIHNKEKDKIIWNSFLTKYLTTVINNWINYLKYKIEELKKTEQSISEIDNEINVIIKKLKTETPNLEELYVIKNKLAGLEKRIFDCIRINKISKKQKWIERAIGFLIGIGASILLYFIGFR